MKLSIHSLIAVVAIISVAPALSETPGHLEMTKKAQRAAYAAENGCQQVPDDLFGWPKSLIEYCEYKQPAKFNTAPKLDGAVYLLKVKPERIAKWIETSCEKRMPGENECFRVVLACGRWNSGYMFAISGNIIESGLNYFFRNGITVNMPPFKNQKDEIMLIDQQRKIALQLNDKVKSIPTGLTRFWRTLPAHFANLYPDAGVPKLLDTKLRQQQWLEFARTEMLATLDRDENRFLEAYMNAYPLTLRSLLSNPNVLENDCPREVGGFR